MKFKDIDPQDNPWDEVKNLPQTDQDIVRSLLTSGLDDKAKLQDKLLKHLIDENNGEPLADDVLIPLINSKKVNYNNRSLVSKEQWDRIKFKIHQNQ